MVARLVREACGENQWMLRTGKKQQQNSTAIATPHALLTALLCSVLTSAVLGHRRALKPVRDEVEHRGLPKASVEGVAVAHRAVPCAAGAARAAVR